MEYRVYRLAFQGAVRFGRQTLTDGASAFCADTLFSALCQEALKRGEDTLRTFCDYARGGQLLLTDAFPYRNDTYYLPKPMIRAKAEAGGANSVLKKAFKRLKYIPAEAIGEYLRGEYDVLSAPDTGGLGGFQMKTAAAVRGEEETNPYRIGIYYFNDGCGLYVAAGCENRQAAELFGGLMESLSYSGIGGKRSSGLGRFRLLPGRLPEEIYKRLMADGDRYMSLSVSLPREEELERALRGAAFLLCRRGGFVASENYAPEQMRKNDLFVMKAGSCFASKYEGDIYDVSGGMGRHPVYRYAKPVFMEVDV